MSKAKSQRCGLCGKHFQSRNACWQHKATVHHTTLKSLPKEVRREIACEVLDDLPDGAFFQAAQDTFGLQPEDWIDE